VTAEATPSLFERPWEWVDEDGRPARLAQWSGTPLVLGAFYAACGKTCPMTVSKLKAIEAAYRASGRTAEIVLVTIDPANDTPRALKAYKAEHGLPVGWHLLRGSLQQTEDFTAVLDIHVVDMTAHLAHGSRIVVFDGRGVQIRGFNCCDFDPRKAVL
jgi:protein SCO1/2